MRKIIKTVKKGVQCVTIGFPEWTIEVIDLLELKMKRADKNL